MTGGSSSKLIWLKEDRALEARVPGGEGPGACSPGKFLNLASLKRTFSAISDRIDELN